MATSSLVGLAFLNVAWSEETATYIDNFIPMVCEVVRTADEEVVTDPLVRDGLQEKFGLTIPQHTVGTLIRRAHRLGYLNRDQHTFSPNRETLANLDFAETRNKVRTLYEGTVERLVTYSREKLDLDWDHQEADSALQDYLAEYSLDVVIAAQEESPIARPEGGPKSRLAVSLFIQHLQENNRGVFSLIEDLFRGAMLANALYVRDPHNLEERFSDTTVYLDSPVLLHAAGYGYESRTRPQKELLELLQDLGANVACFRPTVEEARGILETCATIMEQGAVETARDPARETIDYFYNTGRISTDVHRLAGSLDDRLAVLGISIERRPDFNREFQIDEGGLEEFIRNDFGHYKTEALIHDVEVISNIARLRRLQPKSAIEHCDAIFATHNNDLARVSRKFFSDEPLQGDVGLVITDFQMTNIAWLKRPTAAPNLPLKRVLADCQAAIQPSDDLWQRFINEAKRLRDQDEIDVDDYIHIRHSQEVKRSLAEVTLGDAEAITDGTVPEVLRRARRQSQRDMQEALEAEKRLRKEKEDSLSDRTQRSRNKLQRIARGASKAVGWSCRLAGFAVIVLGVYLSYATDLTALNQGPGRYIWLAGLAIFLIFLIWSSMTGKGWEAISQNLEENAYEKSYHRLLDWWELPPLEDD